MLGFSQIHQRIGKIQADVGNEYSCSYWSWQDAMGGPGGSYFWMRRTPALMAGDLIHLTVPGYQFSARRFIADTKLTNYTGNRLH
jgi:lysophospholipase L1-like esterase